MSVYRDNARWGAQVSEHRASAVSWFAAAILAAGISIALFVLLPRAKHVDPKLWIATLLFPCMAVWMMIVGIGLTKIHLRCFERGLAFTDARGHHEAEWSEITAVEERYNRGNRLISIALAVPSGRIVLPRELRAFDDVRARLDKHVRIAWTRVEIGPIER